ncbi:MAG TPA: glycosyltransferase, partial [Solirubrobacteraceae bacterium]|nr:glycosyltransferase [Solirubrobacteraceae bacterium]
MTEPLAIAHVTPYAWEIRNDVNVLVERVARDLQRRGHRVLVVAPSRDQALVRDSRALVRRNGNLFDGSEPRVLAVGEVLPELPTASRRRAPGLPVDVARTVEELLQTAPLDVVHVHEPFALSTAAAALRHSRALNVGTFHAPAERLVSMQAARRIVEL